MAVDLPTSGFALVNGSRTTDGESEQNSPKAEYKLRRHRFEKMDSSLTELPKCFDEWLVSLNNYCKTGCRLSSLLETALDDTPLLMVVLRYKEACENLIEKYAQQEILQQEFETACKKVGPSVSSLRNGLDVYAKLLNRYDSIQSHMEDIRRVDSNITKKGDHSETKLKIALQELLNQETQLTKATDDLNASRVKNLGSCFLSILEFQAQILTAAGSIMCPLSMYKDIGRSFVDIQNSASIKDATLSWLAAGQVYRNLRTIGNLSRSDVQCLTYSGGDELPETTKKKLNKKVDLLLKSFVNELEKTKGSSTIVSGGFHLNSKGIELALKECCSELEAVGAGAPRAQSRQEKEEQIERDIPRTAFIIGSKKMGGASGSEDNIQEKLMAIEELATTLPETQKQNFASEKIHDFAFHVLNEACSSITQTSAKTAVQLFYGKSNLVLVRPSPHKEVACTISTKGESTLVITAQSTWWLVEDYATLASLSRLLPPDAFLGVIETTYTLELSLVDFVNELSSVNNIPTILVECTHANNDYLLTIHQHQVIHPNSRKTRKGLKYSQHKAPYIYSSPESSSSKDETIELPAGRLPSSDGESLDLTDSNRPSSGTSPSLEGSSCRSDRSRSGSLVRGSKPFSNLHRTNSDESISTIASSVTTVKAHHFVDDSDDITHYLPFDMRTSHSGLTQASVLALTKSESKQSRRYSALRKEEREQLKKRDSDKKPTKQSFTAEKDSEFYTAATPADFDKVFNYLDRNDFRYDNSFYWHQNGKQKEGLAREELKKAEFLSNDNNEDMLQQSQVVGGETIDVMRPSNPHLVSNSSMASIDSGIVMHPRGTGSLKRNDRISSGYMEDVEGGNWGLGNFFSKGLGPFPVYPPVSSDSDSETSGRDSRDNEFIGFRSSRDELPGRSASSASCHSIPLGIGGGVGRPQLDSDSLSLPDEREFQLPFNQAPGSHRGHRRHPSLSSNSSTYGDPLSQQEPFDMPGSRGSFSQEIPMNHSQDDRDMRHHGGHFSSPYDHEMMRPGGPSQFHYGSDPYSGMPPYPHHDRHAHSLNRGRMVHDDFVQSPGPMHRPHHPPPPPPVSAPGGPPHFWDGYGGPTPPSHMMGPHPPPRGHGPPPPHPLPPPEMQFRPVHNFRTNTPDSSSLPSMSPAPSPHPTPPTTPPPSHHPPMMGMVPSPMRMAPNHRPGPIPPGPGPGHHRVPGPMHEYHMPPHPLPSGPPPPRGGPPMVGPLAPSPGPAHMGPHPHGHGPHPPPPNHGHGRMPLPPHPSEWGEPPLNWRLH